MKNAALPATYTLKCHQCEKAIFSTARCLEVRGKLYCGEACANKYAIRKLRNLV
jgi:hypothetical protein